MYIHKLKVFSKLYIHSYIHKINRKEENFIQKTKYGSTNNFNMNIYIQYLRRNFSSFSILDFFQFLEVFLRMGSHLNFKLYR